MKGLVLSLFPGIGLLDMAFEEAGFCVVRGPDVLWGGDIRRFHPPAGRFNGVIGGPPCQVFSSLARLVRANGHEPRFGNLIPEYERVVGESEAAWFLMENVPQAPMPAVEGYAVRDIMLNNAWIAGADGYGQEQERKRRFSFGVRGPEAPNLMRWIQTAALLLPEAERGYAACGSPVAAFDGKGGTERSRRGSVTQWSPDNSPEAKAGKRAMFGDGCPTRKEHRHPAVASSDGAGKVKQVRYTLADACRLQGLPEDFLDDAPFTAAGKLKAVANGVPLPMGRAVAEAVVEAIKVTR